MSYSELLSLENISKSYGENQVLSNVSFTVGAGEIVGLVGENGAGKSTLMNILFGMPVINSTGGYQGVVRFGGEAANFASPKDALAAGIGMVHQEFSLIPGFTGTENILLNRECLHPSVLQHIFDERLGTLNREEMNARAEKALKKLGVNLDPDVKVFELPVGHKQFLEIAREIDRTQTRLLVLDEPTAVLTETEAEILLTAVRKLADLGLGIVFISHRLREITTLCDKVVVLRDGQKITEMPAKETTVREIAAHMVVRSHKAQTAVEANMEVSYEAPPVLKVESLWVDMPGENVDDVSFTVQRGEIFGLAGLAGQGKLGVPAGIMGLKPAGGRVWFEDKPLPLNNPKVILRNGVAFVSEDRRGVGLLLEESIALNAAFSAMQLNGDFLKHCGFFTLKDNEAMTRNAQKYIDLLAIKCENSRQKAGHLSGGNQQKVCLAKAFSLNPRLLFVSEPTRGIDVGAKELVLHSLRDYNQNAGTTIVITSSELEELRSICHRIAVVNEGRVAGILPASASAEKFGLLMSGESLDQEEAA